jgi:hypothetical protein
MSKRVLIIYPHGLGDCILATPALREYKKQTNNYVVFAMMKRLERSELFKHNPWIDEELYILPDPWNDYDSFGNKIGFEGCCAIGKDYVNRGVFDEYIFINHSHSGTKIVETAQQLGLVNLHNPRCDVYIDSSDQEKAYDFMPNVEYGFIHDKTALSYWKNLPDGFSEGYLSTKYGIKEFVVVDKTFLHSQININIQFYLLQRATKVCLIDSVYYHACCAMNKEVDLVYFSKQRNDYNRVRHTISANEVVIDTIPQYYYNLCT